MDKKKLPRDKLGRFMKGIYYGYGFKKINKIFLGRKHSEETKKKLSEAHKGKMRGDENPSKRLEVREKLRKRALERVDKQRELFLKLKQDPEFQRKRLEGITEYNKIANSQKMKYLNKSPEFQKKRVEGMKNSEKYKNSKASWMRKINTDSKLNKKRLNSLKSNETRLKISEAVKGFRNPNYGNKWSDEQREHLSNFKKDFYDKNPEKHLNRIMAQKGFISYPQKKLFQFIKSLLSEAKLEYRIPNTRRDADVGIPRLKLAIECDGERHHDPEKDKQRDLELEKVGWKTVRFPSKLIINNFDKVKKEIIKSLDN